MSAVTRPGEGFTFGTVEVFGHEVGWTAAGAGDETLVICPGSAGSDPSWAKDMLAKRLRVVELNPPGWGGQKPLAHKIDQRDLAVVVAAAIEELGIARYRLHGASMGGATALWLAAQFPQRILSLSLEGGMNFVREEDLASIENARNLAEMVATGNPDGIGYPRAAPHPRKPWSDGAFIRGQMIKRLPMMRVVTNLYEEDLRARLQNVDFPILALLGDADEILRSTYLDRLRDVLPAAQTVLIAGAAHDIQNTEPEQLVSALMSLRGSKR